ncbi:hypothetical protein EDB81DRAFT_446689 [Dactylonectria macrodidyma]|uniref:Serine-rich protein n=1 Tax=Dactylonectria macrodidyma TaxID=307937 RepID=A0A9P9JDJ3_9HYPO|nr:hypothetical protein EDB81DRAFT_446689 [Dactylonectria macrodidyma]
MHLDFRQLPNTPGATMSSATGNGDPLATQETTAPAETTAVDPQSSVVDSNTAAPTTASNNNSQTSAVASASASQDQSSSAAQPTQPSETQASSVAPSSDPVPTTSAQVSSRDPTTAAQTSETSAAPTQPASSSEANNDTTSDPASTQASITTEVPVSTVIVTNTDGAQTSIVVVTTITTNQAATTTGSGASTSSTSGSDGIDSSGGSKGGLSQTSKVAIGVVVPIAAIVILALVGLFWWKKRRARKQNEEERRKEVEDYAYNPNADPTIPAVGMGGDGSYEMREDASSGYRGWGNTTVGSTGRKASTTMSGGQTGQAYSDITSPTAHMSDGRSGEPLMDGSYSPEGEILGAMGPSAANNRGADVHRGPSNASSSYSAARSDGSDPMGTSYGAGGTYYDQYGQNNPYSDNYNGQRPDVPGAPVIRDNPARRNTRIESPSHYPQQSAGISQNF